MNGCTVNGRFSVGDGFIRPDLTTLYATTRYRPQTDERANLGTDKSVPYKTHAPHVPTHTPSITP
ncbi:MAG: hypothetical protein FWG87_05005 [Defluviitaleaceae bacterium]|nr:hypothetical protein [Defluviitaleaceae bacterium]